MLNLLATYSDRCYLLIVIAGRSTGELHHGNGTSLETDF